MKYSLAGFFISALLHAGLLTLVLQGGFNQLPATVESNALPLTLAMFQPVKAPVHAEPPPQQPKPPARLKPRPERKLKPEPAPEPKPKPRPRPKPRVKAKPKPQPEPLPEVVTEVAPLPIATIASAPVTIASSNRTPVAARPARPAEDPKLIARIEANYKAELRRLIEANKQYPRRARRMGREGEVRISFSVLPDGTIQNVSVTGRSGIGSLDQAAIKAVLAASGQLPFPDKIKRNHWKFTLPVAYRLM